MQTNDFIQTEDFVQGFSLSQGNDVKTHDKSYSDLHLEEKKNKVNKCLLCLDAENVSIF